MASTLLRSLLCLLLVLQMNSVTELFRNQSHQLLYPVPCSSDEYMAANHCCKLCPAGQYVGQPCTSPHTRGKCVKCDRGTFTAANNGLDSCLLCSICRDDQEMVSECSLTSDCICQCRAGQFYQDPGSSESCRPCGKCPEGSPVLRECNATANTACGLADSRDRNWLWTLSVLLCLPIMAIIYVLIRGKCQGREMASLQTNSSMLGQHSNPLQPEEAPEEKEP